MLILNIKQGGVNLALQNTLQALADPTRREILKLLKHSRLSAGEISDHFQYLVRLFQGIYRY